MAWEVLWGPAACLAAYEHQPSSGSFSAVAAALQLEFIPDENNEEVPRLRPPLPWRLQARNGSSRPCTLIPTAGGRSPWQHQSPCLHRPACVQQPPPLRLPPQLKPIRQVCEQFIGQSRLCLCRALMNAHHFFFCFFGAPFSPCGSLMDA